MQKPAEGTETHHRSPHSANPAILWTGVCVAVVGKARLPGADAGEDGSCQSQPLCPTQSEL